jgi:hypothetical protein
MVIKIRPMATVQIVNQNLNSPYLSPVNMHEVITQQRLEPMLGEALLDLKTNTNVQII